MQKRIDLAHLSFDNGAHFIIKKALAAALVDSELEVTGVATDWLAQLETWCRTSGHFFRQENNKAYVKVGSFEKQRWLSAEKTKADSTAEVASPRWGLAARGATVESNSPEFHFRLNKKKELWSHNISELYTQAIAAQWDPDKVIDWAQYKIPAHSAELEKAVAQILSYMIENENVALVIPARFLGEMHPHYREVQALLAIQIADEARHIEVFTRRLHLFGSEPGLSTSDGQHSLQTLLNEKNFSISSFLLAVLGEGTFVDLLQFLTEFAPDPVTRKICHLAAIDEARHVSFGMSHLLYHLELEPDFRIKLAQAMEARYEQLISSSGLNAEVFDSLILLAAGDDKPENIEQGFFKVQNLLHRMAKGRRARLERLGFSKSEAQRLSQLHTRNFM